MKESQKSKILWGAFLIVLTIFTFNLVACTNINETSFLILLTFSVLPLLLHAIWTLGRLRGLLFILLSSLTGFIFEFAGLKYGILFGGAYEYHGFKLMLGNVPFIVILSWAAFIYAGYNISSSFLFWTNKPKPQKGHRNAFLLPFLIILDGLIVTAIDVFMDPIQVKIGNWTWLEGGPYLDVPIGNFIGWFTVAIIATSIFRTFEYFYPRDTHCEKSVFLMPVIGYGYLCFIFMFLALKSQMTDLALIGIFTMLPIVVANLLLFLSRKTLHSKKL